MEGDSQLGEQPNPAVFVVHGRNLTLRDSMFSFLRSLALRPIEWDSAISLTGKASPYIGEVLDAAFSYAQAVVVLMTPDEVAYLDPRLGHGEDDQETRPAAQARPNVLFEAGMALGRNPDHTILVEVGDVRPFSDVAGRHSIKLANVPDSRQALVRRLRTAGCPIDLSGTDWLRVGDFSVVGPGDGLPLGRRLPSRGVARRALDFDLHWRDRGIGRLGKLQIVNRGTDTALNVCLEVPEGVALDITRVEQPIPKIPGNGKYVTIDALSLNGTLGSSAREAFDVKVIAETEAGERVEQDVFLDMNG